jgi:bifunctional UDP-N-acetylglucosamine pyrophosphorylase/glucosamine-1-phosphate N-acetyltransferase
VQAEQRGTGHAVELRPARGPSGRRALLILCGDTPLLEAADLERLMRALADAGPQTRARSAHLRGERPRRLRPHLRDGSGASSRARAPDATPTSGHRRDQPRHVRGARGLPAEPAVRQLSPNNAQGELYFTDVVAQAAATKPARSRVKVEDAVVPQRASTTARSSPRRGPCSTRASPIGTAGRRRPSAPSARVDAGVVGADAISSTASCCAGRPRVGAARGIDVGCVLTNVDRPSAP